MATPHARVGHHDWHSTTYVEQWIAHDVTRDDERRPLLRRMLEAAPMPHDAVIAILDVGAGYGVVTEEALRLFPKARAVVQDYSRPMLDRARARLGAGPNLTYVLADLFEPSWAAKVGGPFDLAVSAIALHNLGGRETIFEVYRAIGGLLKPGGYFLNYDRFPGGIEPHATALRGAGFAAADALWQKPPLAILVAGPRG